MRLSLRLIVSLVIGVTLVALLFAYWQVRNEQRRTRNDLELRARVLAESLEVSVVPLLQERSGKELRALVERFGNRERLAGIAVYNEEGKVLAVTSGLAQHFTNRDPVVAEAVVKDAPVDRFLVFGQSYVHLCVLPLHREEKIVGTLVLFHDAEYIRARPWRLWRVTFLSVLVQVGLILLVTLLIVHWSIVGPIARTARWMRELRTGRAYRRPILPETDVLKPLAQEVSHLVKSLEVARAAAEEEARLRDSADSIWTSERLRVHVRSKLQENPLLVVSNREPWMHVRRGKNVETVVPASGLVTALEPILRACNGTWIAHGSGDADVETADERSRLRVPPDDPEYTLRRVWLSSEEEEGYYYGFSNEGLWPLCHIAHTRPIFRDADWNQYREVNRRFARVALEEMEGAEHPLLLVQDYHFALLPRLIKDQRPETRVAVFWHIPWPNPEAFRICPWEEELLGGLLGADLVGFHIQAHCNNFLETVDMALESQIDWERFAVNRSGHETRVRPFPISVALEDSWARPEGDPSRHALRTGLLKELGVSAEFMGIGVDRVDYTKGILERFRAIEQFLERFPSYRGKFTFVQIGAPSRIHIPRYHNLLSEVEHEAERINWRFQTRDWKPLLLLTRHHNHAEIVPYYRAADLCLVTSLHDGMNLVAKEFIATREDEGGALILSRFAGASHELHDALIVNPYDTGQVAEAIRLALEMTPEELTARMRRLRRAVRENNVFRWAGSLLEALLEIRTDKLEAARRS